MIKQIQLRGISRDPSDRMTTDGGCVESLNVQLNNDELEPTPVPVNVSSDLGVPTSLKVLYIHKSNSYTNYVGRDGSNLKAKIAGTTDPVTIAALGSSTDPLGITSIGNILVWTTSSGTNYAIFRDGAYTYLGDSVPEPEVTFRTYAGTQKSEVVYEAMAIAVEIILGLTSMVSPVDAWTMLQNLVNDVATDQATTERRTLATDLYNQVQDGLWAKVNKMRTELRGNSEFSAPVMARYALKLYDGNYIYVSAPVILMGSAEHDFTRMLMGVGSSGGVGTYKWMAYMNNTYTADVRVDFGLAGLWGDLIDSVDIFLSTDIQVPAMNAKVGDAYDTGQKIIGTGSAYNDAGFEMEGVSDYAWLQTSSTKNRFKEDFETKMLEKVNFYKVASIPAFTQAYWEEDLKPKSQDDLVVLERLSEGDAHQISGTGGVGSYNERLILTGEKITLSRGNQKPDAMMPSTATDSALASCFFYIRTSDGGTKVVKGYRELAVSSKERARAYVTYPDPNCFKAEYYIGSVSSGGYSKVTLPMKEHPRINASYGFWGLGYRLDELYTSGDTRTKTTATTVPTEEDRTYSVENRLFLSYPDNPFYFPLGQRVSFSSKILAALPITIPLSTYQFGLWDIYVFTQEGIWAEKITDEGTIATSKPLSRDVAIPGAISQVDNGIVFSTNQGVMLLTVDGAKNISPNLGAERDALGAGGSLSNLGDWASLMTIATDDTSFLQFIKNAKYSYDYPGKRFMVFNPSESYSWTYKLDTGTWHRQQNPTGSPEAVINSYPEAYVTFNNSSSYSVIDYTTVKGESYPLRTALVVTRGFDLGMPDVRKQIKAIRIRGDYRMGGSAQFILMGSMDGKYYDKITSFRSGSYKFYKLALLLKLYPDERISWIDVDFDARFTNKLR